MSKRSDVKRCDLSVEEWADKQTFTSTEQIQIPDLMADRVIGQEDAVEVMRKAASQKRHVMLIGEPGTGKSMLANSMVEYLPKEELQDIVAYHNPEDFNEPRVRVFPAGKGKAVVAEQKAMQKNQKNTMYIYAILAIIVIGLLAAIMLNNFTIVWIALLGALIIMLFFRTPGQPRTETAIVPKVLVGHDPGDMPPFVDATGTHAGALLGDVRHDPFQSGGLETPSHDRLEAGDIHKANKGVLYIDEQARGRGHPQGEQGCAVHRRDQHAQDGVPAGPAHSDAGEEDVHHRPVRALLRSPCQVRAGPVRLHPRLRR